MNARRLASTVAIPALLLFAYQCAAKTLIVGGQPHANDGAVFRTLGEALKQLRTGDTLIVGDGVYRESIDLRLTQMETGERAGPTVTRIEAAEGAHPLLKGSDIVSGWKRIEGDLFVKTDWSSNSQQVFVAGVALKQIGGLIFGDFPDNPKHAFASLHRSQGGIWPGRTPGGVQQLIDESFYYDQNQHALYVKSKRDIRQLVVEVSTRPYLIFGDQHHNVRFRGFRLEHANTTSLSQSGAITLIGNRLELDDIHIQSVDGAGLDITGDDNVVKRSVANRCGSVGMKVRGRHAKLVDNETNFNNTRGFNKWWEAGGAKFVGAGGLQHSEVNGHRAIANNGDGVWFDWRNDDNRVHRVVSAYNAGMGIHYEASRRAFIFDNYVFGNSQRGIYLANASDSVVAHNLVAANEMEGIAVVDDRHAAVKGPPDLVPVGNQVLANIIAWNRKAALILPDARDNRSDANVFVGADPAFSLGWPTREQPLNIGLAAWQSRTTQDRYSSAQSTSLPSELREQLAMRNPASATPELWQPLMRSAQATPQENMPPPIEGVPDVLARHGNAPGPAP